MKQRIKKSLSLFLILALTFTTMVPTSVAWADTSVQAEDEAITTVASGVAGDYANWKLTSDGVLTISGSGGMYGCNPEYNSYAPWNSYKSSIKEVVIKVGITSIGAFNFWDCENLKKITIPASVKTIGRRAFCISGIETITLPKSVERIEEEAFLNSSLTNINIPDSVTEIGRNAFLGCNVEVIHGRNNGFTWDITKSTGVLNVYGSGEMPNYDVVNNRYVIWHGYEEFIKTVNIGEGITSIGSYTFWDAETLEKVNLPSTLTKIEDSAFLLCGNLQNVSFPKGLKHIGAWAFASCLSMTELNLPAGLEYVGSNAFNDCIGLTSVTLPNSITYIGVDVFLDCGNLKTVTLPQNDQFTSLPSGIFSGCKNLSTVNLPDTITVIGASAFENCTSLTSMNWPKNLTTIASGAFVGCTGLTNIVIPDSVNEVQAGTFEGCSNLTNLKLPANIEYIGTDLINGCTKLTTIEVPKKVTILYNRAFAGASGLTEVILPEGLKEIQYMAFEGCGSLSKINLPSTVETIESSAFMDCAALKGITLPKAVSSVGDYAFSGTSLAEITIENSACQLGTAFLPDMTKTIKGYAGSTAEKYADFYELSFVSLGKSSLTDWNAALAIKQRFYYDGTAKEPELKVDNGGRDALVPTVDYTVTYSNNVNAGKATALIQGIGNYTGQQTVEFDIYPQEYLSDYTVVLEQDSVTYNGKPQTPKFKIVGPKELVEGVDYTYYYVDNVNAKPSYQHAYVQIKGMGNYREAVLLSGSFNINPLDLSGLPIQLEYTEADYTGSAICPKVTIPGYESLVEGSDYTVVYENNYNAGTATVYVKGAGYYGNGNCTGQSASATFTIKPNDIASLKAGASLSQSAYDYTGDSFYPTVSIIGKDGQKLTQNTHYTLKYENNKEIGTATVTVTGKGVYVGSFTMNFTIEPKLVTDMDLELQYTSYKYSGYTIQPMIYGFDYGMNEGKDYTITYKNNLNAGQGQVIFTGKGNYGGSKTLTFTITPAAIKDEYPYFYSTNYAYTGDPIRPNVNGLDHLQKNVDYTITYKDNVNPGLATITVKGIGNYTGSVGYFFTITAPKEEPKDEPADKPEDKPADKPEDKPADKPQDEPSDDPKDEPVQKKIGDFKLSYSKTTYSGSAKKPKVTIKGLKQGTDYTVSYKNNVKAGKATVTVKGCGDYTGTVSKTFTISKKSIGSKATLSYSKTTYSGSSKKPTVKITGLKKGTHYTVTYSNNKNVGKATVKIKGTGNYTGTITKTFTINPKGTSITKKPTAAKKAFTVKWKKVSSQASGYEIMYSTSKKFTKATSKTVKVTSYKTTSKKISKLKAKKTYYVKVRTYKTVSGKKYYSNWSGYKTVKTK